MFSLAVGTKSPLVESKVPLSLTQHMMQNALWFPGRPPTNVIHNEGSFPEGDPLIPGYRPVLWTLFGGYDGSKLSTLKKVAVEMGGDQLLDMRFCYGGKPRRESRFSAGFPMTKMGNELSRGFPLD